MGRTWLHAALEFDKNENCLKWQTPAPGLRVICVTAKGHGRRPESETYKILLYFFESKKEITLCANCRA